MVFLRVHTALATVRTAREATSRGNDQMVASGGVGSRALGDEGVTVRTGQSAGRNPAAASPAKPENPMKRQWRVRESQPKVHC